MIGVDTNVVLRLLVRDDAAQTRAAIRYLDAHASAEDPALVSTVAVVETVWVLEDVYGYSRAEIAAAVEGLLSMAQLRVDDGGAVAVALHRFRRATADFADCLLGVVNVALGCSHTATFDRKASRLDEFRLVTA